LTDVNSRLHFFRGGGASLIATETPNPGGEGLQVVRRAEPHSRIIYSDSIQAEQQTEQEVDAEEESTGKRFVVVLLILFALAAFAAGSIYWYQTRHFPVVVAIAPPDRPLHPDPLGNRGRLVPISPDVLHVTSIAMGKPRLTIVNGKRLAEEDWLVVKTPSGEASVRVLSIEDGLVRFKHGGETIDARLQTIQRPVPH
jgi:hypothetical protein